MVNNGIVEMDVWFDLLQVSRSTLCVRKWYWYVDDREMKCQKDQPDEILKHLNSIKPDVIVFTKKRSRGRCFTSIGSKAKGRQKDEADQVHGLLQENTHQHHHQRRVKSSSLCEKRYYKGVCDDILYTM